MKYEYIFFDLDGTITDSVAGILNTFEFTLRELGLEGKDRESLRKYVGPPLMDTFNNEFGFDAETVTKAYNIFRERYYVKGAYENELFTGIKDLIAKLCDKGIKLYLATSKNEKGTQIVMEHFGLTDYFEFLGSASMDGSRANKIDVMGHVLDNCEVDSSKAIMVGDRRYDIEGGKHYGFVTVGVTYGYSDSTELEIAGADHIVSTVNELEKLLFSLCELA